VIPSRDTSNGLTTELSLFRKTLFRQIEYHYLLAWGVSQALGDYLARPLISSRFALLIGGGNARWADLAGRQPTCLAEDAVRSRHSVSAQKDDSGKLAANVAKSSNNTQKSCSIGKGSRQILVILNN
jgi:hypothetical protein